MSFPFSNNMYHHHAGTKYLYSVSTMRYFDARLFICSYAMTKSTIAEVSESRSYRAAPPIHFAEIVKYSGLIFNFSLVPSSLVLIYSLDKYKKIESKKFVNHMYKKGSTWTRPHLRMPHNYGTNPMGHIPLKTYLKDLDILWLGAAHAVLFTSTPP